jgi:GNAT superfamily N-acetyltransferase
VCDGDVAVGWCEYGPPEELSNIYHRKQYEEGLDKMPSYRLTCLFVDRDYRRKGVAAVAVHGALDLIAKAGGGVVEAYRRTRRDRRFRRRSCTTAPALCSRRPAFATCAAKARATA